MYILLRLSAKVAKVRSHPGVANDEDHCQKCSGAIVRSLPYRICHRGPQEYPDQTDGSTSLETTDNRPGQEQHFGAKIAIKAVPESKYWPESFY